MQHSGLTKYLVPFLFVIMLCLGAETVKAVTVFCVTNNNQLIRFDAAAPEAIVTVGTITGMQPGEVILGMDFRPATGQLFALGNADRLYTIDRSTGAATLIAPLSIPLNGVTFGFDFNPTVDRIRIVSSTGRNYRVNPINGAVTVDGNLNPGGPNVTAAAYNNSFGGSTSTTLFVIDTTTDALYIQNPPNNGTLTPVGQLGVDAGAANGFDISSSAGVGFAALTVAGATALYTVNPVTGAAFAVGLIGTGVTSMRAMAIESGSDAPNLLVYGLTTSNQLVRFNSTRPNTILSTVSITGLQIGENLLGIDFRPATGGLFGIGTTNRLYSINTATGAATQVGTAGLFTLLGADFGFDLNPVADRIRMVSDLEQNLRINPINATLTANDGALAYPIGDPNSGQDPNIVGAAYSNSFNGATSTTLFDIDSNLDILTTQNPPNNGILNTVGPLGVNTTDIVGFDIAPGNNTALAAMQLVGDAASKLYSINLFNGNTSFIGPIGTILALRGIAIAPGSPTGRRADFDGDGRTDYSVFRPSINSWLISRSFDGSFFNFQWGVDQTDILTPGDYDGDGKTDIAVWRTTDGTFYVLRSSDNQPQYFQFGASGDEPVAKDYDGDGKTDFAVVRRVNGQLIWYIANSGSGTFRSEQFGLASDLPTPGDYDGDGRFDLGVRRGAAGEQAVFYTQNSTTGTSVAVWGLGSDLVVPGDYDGDGKTDFTAVRLGSTITWYILASSTGSFIIESFGTNLQEPVPGDYDGDGHTDIAVWEPSTGVYSVLRSTNRFTTNFQFGQSGDEPVARFSTH